MAFDITTHAILRSAGGTAVARQHRSSIERRFQMHNKKVPVRRRQSRSLKGAQSEEGASSTVQTPGTTAATGQLISELMG